MKLKKILALLLALIMVISLVACGSDEEEPSESSTEPSSSEEEYLQTVFRSDSNQTLYSDRSCSFHLVKTGRDAEGNYCWTVELKNLTNQELLMSLDDAYVNDFAADPCWAVTLAAGETRVAEISWFASDFAACGITTVGRINVRLRAYPKAKPQSLLVDEELTVYPAGIEAYTAQWRTWLTSDRVLLESELCALAVTEIIADSVHGDVEGYTLRLYLENRSQSDAAFSIESVLLNGQSAAVDWVRPLGEGKKFFVDLYWSDSEMAELEIAQVLSVQLELVMRDSSGAELARETLSFNP